MQYRTSARILAGWAVLTYGATTATGQVQPSLHGTVETYMFTKSGTAGAYQQLSWMELRGRLDPHWSATWSGYDFQSIAGYDETYGQYENSNWSVRAGRLRTSFGFSNWSELFYNGFNHKPLVRETSLVGKTRLDRDDSGAEATLNVGALQIQASAIDTSLTKEQVGPDTVDHATLTAQYGLGSLVLGAEMLAQTDGSQKIYGGNFRYTVPHWILNGEAFGGVGPQSASGSYLDATYRVPQWIRTELVARLDLLKAAGQEESTQLQTVGVRYIFNRYLQMNLNYGWGSNLNYSGYAQSLGLAGWTTRVMFQEQF